MTLLTRKQIAELTNRTVQAVGNSIRRGHLIEVDKRISTDNPQNKRHLAKFISRSIKTDESENGSISNLDKLLKEHDLQLKKVKIKKENLDYDKKQAKLINVLDAKDIMIRSIVILSNQYRNTAKQYLIEIAAEFNISDSALPEIQKRFDKTINQGVLDSKDLIKIECEIMANKFTE